MGGRRRAGAAAPNLGSRLVAQPLVAALRRWIEHLAQQERLASAARRVLAPGVGRAFGTWCESIEARRGGRKRMARFARRMVHRGLGRAWSRWLELLDERAALAKFARRLLSRDVLRGWGAWREMMAEMRRLRKFGARLVMRASARAFEAWAEHAAEQRRRQRFLRRWMHAGVGRAFNAWCDLCAQRARGEARGARRRPHARRADGDGLRRVGRVGRRRAAPPARADAAHDQPDAHAAARADV